MSFKVHLSNTPKNRLLSLIPVIENKDTRVGMQIPVLKKEKKSDVTSDTLVTKAKNIVSVQVPDIKSDNSKKRKRPEDTEVLTNFAKAQILDAFIFGLNRRKCRINCVLCKQELACNLPIVERLF